MLEVGIYRRGILLFTLCPNQPTYAQAAFACCLFEAAELPLEPGDYIACDWIN